MKKIIAIIIIMFITGCYVSCDNNSNDPVEILKQRINKAEMVEYVDTLYGAKLLYPDFFKIDSVGKIYADFSYSDENVKELSLSYFRYPPRLIESSKDFVRRHSDSLTTFSRVKRGSFIITEEYENFPRIKCVLKFYHTRYGWAGYCLTYEKQYEDAVERLIKMVKDWKIYNDDYPKWFIDFFDFLDL
jgi:hypothetical protein